MATEALRRADGPSLVKIRPPRRWAVPDLPELWRFRELLWVLGRRDVTLRYRQTVVGAVWILAGPLLSAGVFAFVFGRVAQLSSDGIPYFPFSYAGLILWTVFASTIAKTSTSLVSNSAVITKAYFPRLVLPFSTVFGALTNFVVTLGMMGVLMVAYGLPFTSRLFLLPVILLLLVMLALGVGAALSAGAASYRDISLVTPTLTSLLLYLSPVAYGTSTVPTELQSIYLLNPIATLIELWRWSVLGTGTFFAWSVIISVGTVVAVFVIGIVVFTRLEPRFPDVI